MLYGYVRVSSREQAVHGSSPEQQEERIRAEASRRGEPVTIIREVESGGEERLERRVELKRLLALVGPGDKVAVSKTDRWSRDMVFGVKSVRDLTRKGIVWLAIDEGIDASTPHGQFALKFMAMAADNERERIRERTVGRCAELRDRGCYVSGRVPYGYDRSKDRRSLVINDAEAEIVRYVFARAGSGASIREIAVDLDIEHPRTAGAWTHRLVFAILTSRWCLGEVRSSARRWIPGAHPPIITREVFERAMTGLAARRCGGRPGSAEARSAAFLLRGIAVCGFCGRRMGFVYGRHDYYGCNGRLRGADRCTSSRYLRVPEVDAVVAQLALERLVELRAELSRPPTPRSSRGTAATAEARRARLAEERARAVTLATKGRITAEELYAQIERIEADLRRLDAAEARAANAQRAASPATRRALLARVEEVRGRWEVLDVAGRREVLRELAVQIVLRTGHPPAVTWRTVGELGEELDT